MKLFLISFFIFAVSVAGASFLNERHQQFGNFTPRVLWNVSVPQPQTSSAQHNGVVYILVADGLLALEEKSGTTIFHWKFPSTERIEFAARPLISSKTDTVFFSSNTTQYALFFNGTLKWSKVAFESFAGLPLAVSANGEVLFCTTDRESFAVNADNGNFLWNGYTTYDTQLQNAVAWEDLFIVAVGPSTNPGVTAFLQWNGSVAWYAPQTEEAINVAVFGDVAYEVLEDSSANQFLNATHARTGKVLWSWSYSSSSEGPAVKIAAPIVDDGKVYFGITLFPVATQPSVTFIALDAATGKTLFSIAHSTPAEIVAAPIVVGSTVVFNVGQFTQPNFCAVGLHKHSGKQEWEFLSHNSMDVGITYSALTGSMFLIGENGPRGQTLSLQIAPVNVQEKHCDHSSSCSTHCRPVQLAEGCGPGSSDATSWMRECVSGGKAMMVTEYNNGVGCNGEENWKKVFAVGKCYNDVGGKSFEVEACRGF